MCTEIIFGYHLTDDATICVYNLQVLGSFSITQLHLAGEICNSATLCLHDMSGRNLRSFVTAHRVADTGDFLPVNFY